MRHPTCQGYDGKQPAAIGFCRMPQPELARCYAAEQPAKSTFGELLQPESLQGVALLNSRRPVIAGKCSTSACRVACCIAGGWVLTSREFCCDSYSGIKVRSGAWGSFHLTASCHSFGGRWPELVSVWMHFCNPHVPMV